MKQSYLLLACLILGAGSAFGLDYVELRSGRIIEGVVIRQDTTAIFLTDWESRHLRQPPLQVFGRDEVVAIWLTKPRKTSGAKRSFRPSSGQLEATGSFSFQTWEASNHGRRTLGQLSLTGGLSITRILGLEAGADVTLPSGDEESTAWRDLDFSHQVTVSVVAHLPVTSPLIPYALLGGGSAEGIPTAGLLFTEADAKVRSVVHGGLGVKYGVDRLGVRIELRHSYYTWEDEELVLDADDLPNLTIRRLSRSADATMLRVGIFTYF